MPLKLSKDEEIVRARNYCGIGRRPSGKQWGNARTCVRFGQVRQYGLYLLPRDLLLKYRARDKKMRKAGCKRARGLKATELRTRK